MNVKALLHDSPSDLHRRPRHDPLDISSQWPQRLPSSPHSLPSLPPSAQPPSSAHPSPAMASLRPIDSPRPGIDPSVNHGPNPVAVTPAAGVGRRIPTPTPLTAPSSVTGHGVWSPERSSGSDFLKDRDPPRDLRDWDRVQRDQRDPRRDQLRDRERPGLHPPLPPPLTAFGDTLRRKNIAMEVNGPLAGPGIPLGPAIPSPDDLASRPHHSGSSSRRQSVSNSTIDVGKKIPSPGEDDIRGREPQQRHQEIQLKERSVREPSRERERENWDNDHAYHQRNGPRKIIKAYNPYAPEQARDYRYINSGLDGPGIPPSSDYRGSYRMQPPGQPPPPPPHPSMREGGRTTPKAEPIVLNRSNPIGPPVTTSERDRERDSGPGPLLNERERERDRERDRERAERDRNVWDRDREWEREREHNTHMGYPDGDRERGLPPPPMGSVPRHPSLPPPSLPHGHGTHSHSHSHGQSHHNQHHSQHRDQGSHSHSHHSASHHRPPSTADPHHHQPPGPHKGPPHPHGHSTSRHPSQLIHHPQPQPPGQIQLHPHPQPQHSHSHVSHSHSQSHSHPHSSQHPPPPPPSSQPHSPHPSHMHGPPPSQPHPGYRSQPPSLASAPGPLGGELSPHHHHHHHHHHHPPPPSHSSSHHHHPSSAGPPPQRQFQSQFHTQFIPGLPQPGSRMGSPVSGMPQQQRGLQPSGGPSNTSGPPTSHQQQLPPSDLKTAGLGLSGVPGLDPVDASYNIAAKSNSPQSGKKALAGIKTGDMDRDGSAPLDKNGARRSYMDIDEMQVPEEAVSGVGRVVLTGEESEEEREFKAKVQVNLGTFVYPRLPFPYFFDLGGGIPVRPEKNDIDNSERKAGEIVEKDAEKVDRPSVDAKSTERNEETKNDQENSAALEKSDDTMDVDNKEKDKDAVPKEDKDMLDLETRVTVIIPNGHLPLEKPLRPRIWGGGLPERSHKDVKTDSKVDSSQNRSDKQVTTVQKRRRRIYTDDSDLFLCALHSGWLTWSGAIQAKSHGRDVKLDLRVIKCCGAPGGARLVEGVARKEELVGRFFGGYGERCFNDAGKVHKSEKQGEDNKKGKDREDKDRDQQPDATDVENSVEDDASDTDDDGRGLKSAAWGSGHDGSAIEVLGVEFLEQKATARTSPSLGLRNRAQRMWEYNERRMAILGFATSNARGSLARLPGRKRRRACEWQLSYPRRLPSADAIPEYEEEDDHELTVGDDIPEERTQMSIHTVVFGIGKISTGFKYVPSVLQDVMFPGSSTLDCQPPPKKRRKANDSADVEMADAQPTAQQTSQNTMRPIVLLTESEQYLFSPSTAEQAAAGDPVKYDISLFATGSSKSTTTVTNGNSQAREPKTDAKPLKSGVGQPSFRFLKEEIVIEDLKIRICRWRWGPSVLSVAS